MLKKIDYQKELNPAQFEAVQSTEGQFLVIAEDFNDIYLEEIIWERPKPD